MASCWSVCLVIERSANRSRVSHGGTKARSFGSVRWMTSVSPRLRVRMASCWSLLCLVIERRANRSRVSHGGTKARSFGSVRWMTSVSPRLRVRMASCWSLLCLVIERRANRSRVSHGGTKARSFGSVRWMSLRVSASPCEKWRRAGLCVWSLSAVPIGAGFHTEARRHGAWVLMWLMFVCLQYL
jgi:hypothetical protein